ncbi:MAG TPA: hypothetical protein VG675_19500 [Bryobacteraceae bacterium]|nr:hypothetical protein [Bryobacteraceae bacterium]
MGILVSHGGVMFGHPPSLAAFANVFVWRLHPFEIISLRILAIVSISSVQMRDPEQNKSTVTAFYDLMPRSGNSFVHLREVQVRSRQNSVLAQISPDAIECSLNLGVQFLAAEVPLGKCMCVWTPRADDG